MPHPILSLPAAVLRRELPSFQTLSLRGGGHVFQLLDQQQLPHAEIWVDSHRLDEAIGHIKALRVRGAPAIGVAAALSIAAAAIHRQEIYDVPSALTAIARVRAARPTAVNLMYAMDLLRDAIDNPSLIDAPFSYVLHLLLEHSVQILNEDIALCEKMAQAGSPLIDDTDGILTICNTGGLATAGIGTALGVIRRAFEDGKRIHVYACETRPLLQGARLTAWELQHLQIPSTLLGDSMAAVLMQSGKIQKIFVGSDRIAANGDFANKIGTYTLAVLAKHHGIPFYVVAPHTTVDLACACGQEIPIEERHSDEVRGAAGSFGRVLWAPKDFPVFNPAFDVTPAALVSGWVLDTGFYTDPAMMAFAVTHVGKPA